MVRIFPSIISALAIVPLLAQSVGTFTPTGGLATPQQFPYATLLGANGKTLIAEYGVQIYDWPSGMFTAAAGSAFPYAASATQLLNEKVLITQTDGTSAQIYDPNSGTFTITGAMTVVRDFPVAILLPNGKVLFVGGYQDVQVMPADLTAEVYDPDSGSFTPAGNWVGEGQVNNAILLTDGRVLVISYTTGHAAIYDPDTAAFLPTAGNGFLTSSAILLPNGRVLFTGGIDDLGPSSQAALYDPSSGAFTAIGPMTTPRLDHSATLLSDGTVLLAGGQAPGSGGGGAIASAEIYDPVQNTFQATGSMSTPRFGVSGW